MNAAVRAVVRMGIYLGCKVYLINEVIIFQNLATNRPLAIINLFY